VPYAKTGGLGDVLGTLPKALAKRGHEVKVFIPKYGFLSKQQHQLEELGWSHQIPIGDRKEPVTVSVVRDRKICLETYFIANSHFFDRPGLYSDPQTKKDFTDNDERFTFFSRSVLETARKIGFKPDLVHVHDWQAGLIPVFLETVYAGDPFFKGVKSVLTIHNLAHQGVFAKDRFVGLCLPEELFWATSPMEFYGKVNFLKAAIVYADKITTVSPRYAEEIQTGRFGCGLEGVLRERSADLVGILNGVDYTTWSPSRDKKIPFKYYPANLSGKKMNKVELLRTARLPIREKTPLVGMITRLAHQKGFELIKEAAGRLFAMNIQMIVLGTGEEKYHKLFELLEKEYPDKLKAYLVHDENLAHRIEASADIFLMPSLFEPCGLNQMYSLKYGTVPIVNEVGGLADTITDVDSETGEGTGFVFREETPEAMLSALQRAIDSYTKRRKWTKIMKAGMHQNFSWDKSVDKYCELFEHMLEA
ncbi:MAG: glycogen synthase GlgA, partial [candidate division Zixibacteria bacterium]|nr:glycogen synthase GlgA [candidate division Zixibacteria bacterium]